MAPRRSGDYQVLDLESLQLAPGSSAATHQEQQQWRSVDELEREQQLHEAAPLRFQQQQQPGQAALGDGFDSSGAAAGAVHGQRGYSTRRTGRRRACAVFGGLLVVFVAAAASTTLHQYFAPPSSQQREQQQQEQNVRASHIKNNTTAAATGAAAEATHTGSGPSGSSNTNSSSRGSQGSGSSSGSGGAAPDAAGGARDHHQQQHQAGVWHEGGGEALSFADLAKPRPPADAVPCRGPDLQCGVVHRLPVLQVDFRNLSRRVVARRGAVAADSSRCSQLGRDVLAAGGNAVDAAVAAALCQGVVNPMSSGLGGGAFISVRMANGSAAFWDAREAAPAAASRDMFDAGRAPAGASLNGGLAVAVPGELAGLEAAWRRFGSKPWADLVRPAARLARSGFAAHPYLAYILAGPVNRARVMASRELREAFLIRVPGSGSGGNSSSGSWRVPHVGELCCKRPALANTLDQIALHGAAYLTSPKVTAAHAAELAAAGGIITQHDLAAAAPVERQLLRATLGDLELLVPPPPSSAAVVAFVLKFLAGYGDTLQANSSSGNSSGNSSAGSSGSSGEPAVGFGAGRVSDGGLGLHRLVEAFKHGFAIRTALGDPGSSSGSSSRSTAAGAGAAAAAPAFPGAAAIRAAASDLLNDTFIASLRGATRDDGVLPDSAYGGRWSPRAVPEEHGTSHLSVVDEQRNAVSMTTSINTPFGSGVASPTTGIIFDNTMDDFSSPAKRTFVSPHPSEGNFIAPGRRPLSAMSPLIVAHKPTGRLVAVAGASGGPLILSATAQTLARLLLEGADVGAAVSAPRLHEQLLPTHDCHHEDFVFGAAPFRVPAAALSSLRARGQVTRPTQRGLGVSQAVFVDYSGGRGSRGVLIAQSDPRKDGAPAGYG